MLKPHRKDKMTPLERAQAIEEGRKYDRIRCGLSLGEMKAKLIGEDMNKLVSSVEVMVKSEIVAFNRFGQDGISMGANSYGIAEAMGANVCYPKDNLPFITAPAITDYRMLDDMGPVNPEKDGRIPLYLEACSILEREAKGIVGIGSSIGGPFTIASYLRGAVNLLKDTHRCPENVHKLMRIVTESSKNCIDAFSIFGVSVAMADPMASGSVISPKVFEKFVFPYLKELTDYALLKTGKKASLHMCGKTEKLWKWMNKLNIASFSLDEKVDLCQAKNELGIKTCLAGNVSPVEVILQGNKESITRSVKECIKKGHDSPQGYILGFGCQAPPLTPGKNIEYFMEAARKFGTYEKMNEM